MLKFYMKDGVTLKISGEYNLEQLSDRMVDKYKKVKIDTTGTPETTIEFNDLDELLSLDCDEIIIYKQAQFSENDKKDDECEYTIEICNL